MPRKPSSPARRYSWRGNSPASSQAVACGAISLLAKRATESASASRVARRSSFTTSTARRALGNAHGLGQDAQHHLVGAAADGAQAAVAEQARHAVLPGEAHA